MIERLTLSGAARYTHVEATARGGAQDSFSDTTWKVGADWAVTEWLRFRGTWGTSFRAPALFELFLQDQTGFLGQSDIDPRSEEHTSELQSLMRISYAVFCLKKKKKKKKTLSHIRLNPQSSKQTSQYEMNNYSNTTGHKCY